MDNKGQPPPPYPGEPLQYGGAAPYGSAYPQPAPMPQVTTTTYYQGATSAHIVPGPTVVIAHGCVLCPHCQSNHWVDEYDVCTLVMIILLTILFFPIGLLYLFCLPSATLRRCGNCHHRL